MSDTKPEKLEPYNFEWLDIPADKRALEYNTWMDVLIKRAYATYGVPARLFSKPGECSE